MKHAMIEVDKMLHLRRYVLTVLRADAKSRIARSLHSTSSPLSRGSTFSCEGGYVSRYHRYVSSNYVATELSRTNYIVCGRTFGTTVAQSSTDDLDQKVISFCDEAKHGRLSADRLREIIRFCDENDFQLHADNGILLLKCCGDSTLKTSEERDLVDQVWRLVQKNGETLTLEHYNTLLEVYAKNAKSVHPKKFLTDMRVKPDENTYRLLLNAAAKVNNTEHLQSILSIIKEKNISLDEDAYVALIQTNMASGNIAEAERMITLAKSANLPMDKLYAELACGYASLGDIPNLVKILNDEPQKEDSLLRILKTLSISGNGRHIPVVLNFLAVSVPTIKSKILQTIVELVRADRAADVHTIINCIALNKAIASHANSYVNSFLNELIMIDAPIEDITRYASEYVESGHDPLALTNAAETSLKLGRESLCFAIFKAMQEKHIEVRPHYYWPLLLIAHRNKGETKVFSLVKSMLDAGVELDSDTFVKHVFPYVNTANPIIVLEKLETNGLSSFIVGTPLITFLLLKNRLQDAVDLCKYRYMKLYYRQLIVPLVRACKSTQDFENCVTLLTIFPEGHNYIAFYLKTLLNDKYSNFYIEDLEFLLKTFRKHNGKISIQDATNLKNELANIDFNAGENANLTNAIDDLVDNRLENSALTPIPHGRYMNSKELECFLVELKSKNISTKATLIRMLKLYCDENNLKKAEEIKQELDAQQFQWSPSMKTYLFQLYTKHNKLKEAENLLFDLQGMSDMFLIDNAKILMFATALVNAKKVQSAFDVIKNVTNVNNRKNAEKQCYTLLIKLAQSEYYSDTENMLRLLIKKKYCTPSVEILRPLVALSLDRNDILFAVNTFVRCVKLYKKAPLAQELLTALLQQKDSSKLLDADKYIEMVYGTVVSIHGQEVANTLLVIGLATLNKMEELRSILQKRSISTNTLMHYCQYAQRINKVDALFRIFEAISDTDSLYEDFLCDMLLSAYSRISDYDKALTLWKIMCEKNIKPSKQFRENFSQLLLLNKIPLPLEFESHNSEINVSN